MSVLAQRKAWLVDSLAFIREEAGMDSKYWQTMSGCHEGHERMHLYLANILKHAEKGEKTLIRVRARGGLLYQQA